MEKYFPPKKKDKDALKFLLIDLSTYYVKDGDNREYDVIEPPLGLMALLSYINEQDFANKINDKMIKSFIDFNSNDELVNLIKDFNPDVIGIRAMTFYRKFFHDAIAHVRKNGITKPIIVGGPYPTASYTEVLKDKNINVVVIAEGEITITDILKRTLDNDKHFPDKEELKKVTKKEIQINIYEIKRPELDALLVAESVAKQIEGRISFRRAAKMSVASSMRMGAEGVKIMISGRLNGAEMARTEQYKDGIRAEPAVPRTRRKKRLNFNIQTSNPNA